MFASQAELEWDIEISTQKAVLYSTHMPSFDYVADMKRILYPDRSALRSIYRTTGRPIHAMIRLKADRRKELLVP